MTVPSAQLASAVLEDRGVSAFLIIDAAGVITRWSPAAEALFGWPPVDALGSVLVDLLVPPKQRESHRAGLASTVAGQPSQLLDRTIDLTALHRDGSTLRVAVTSWQVMEGRRPTFHAFLRDVTARRIAELRLRNSEELLQRLVDGTREYGIFMLDPDGVIVTWNLGAQRITGYTEAEAIGQHFSVFYTPEAIASGHPARELARATAEGRYEETAERVRKDGSDFCAHVVITPLHDPTGRLRGFSKVTRDLTDELAADKALRASEERFRRAFDDAPTAAAVIDPQGRYLQVNQGLADLTGYSAEALLGMSVLDLTHPSDRRSDSASLADLVSGATTTYNLDKRYLHADGSTLWVNIHVVPVLDSDGRVSTLICHALDITQRHRYEEQLVELANHDPLTGLANRTRFHQELQGHLDRCRRHGLTGAVLMLDLDRFKTINDSLGHNAGDELIISMANVLRARMRTSDVVSRLGGDEFAILICDGGRAEAEAVANAVLEAVRQDVTSLAGGRPRPITASVGVAVVGDAGLSPIELLAEADLAMYDAKEAGRDCFRLYASAEHAAPRAKAHLTWAARIEAALANDAFELWAQPIVDLRTGVSSSSELLLRMREPGRETVGPDAFLYIAERLGLIGDIDRWVVTHAVDLLAEVQKTRPAYQLAVNISGLSVGNAGLRDHIAGRLSSSGADPTGLVFEITETAAVERILSARDFAEHLRALGCKFALDDFGAGFGSFYYLKHLPFDYVKLDGEFIAHCTRNLTDRLVIDAVVGICKGLGKQTVAEFVGDEATLQFLRSRGIDYAQGFHLGRPVPVDEAFPDLSS